MEIREISERPELLETAIQYFWNCWGSENNFTFYRDCMVHSMDPANALPKFYIALEENNIIGSYALLTNDIISRQDLMPWFACLFVNEDKRNHGLAGELLQHGLREAASKGYEQLYLSSDLVGFYERKGWKCIGEGYNVFGEGINMFSCKTL